MSAVLICPARTAAVADLAPKVPLVLTPIAGQSVLEYWLAYLAGEGAQRVTLIAGEDATQIAAHVGGGSRWGLAVSLRCEPAVSTGLPCDGQADPGAAWSGGTVLDHLPGMPERPLFASYADFFLAANSWLPRAKTPDRVGMREIEPGIWAGYNARISPDADLQAPCWIGSHTRVKSGACVGPYALLEEGSVAEPDSHITSTYVGPHTFVGRYAELRNAIVWGNRLIHWQSGQSRLVEEPFVLCSLRPERFTNSSSWVARLASLYGGKGPRPRTA